MMLTIGGRSHPVCPLEELDIVRGIGEGTLVANLRNRLGCRDEQEPRVSQSLLHIPFVGWQVEVSAKLFFERGKRTIGFGCQILDGYHAEDVIVDNLLEILLLLVYRIEDAVFDASILLRNDEVDELGHLDVLGRLIPMKRILTQVAVHVLKEGLKRG